MFLLFIFCLFFCFVFDSFFIIPVAKEKIRVKLALAITAAAPTTVTKEIIDTPPLAADKTIEVLSK